MVIDNGVVIGIAIELLKIYIVVRRQNMFLFLKFIFLVYFVFKKCSRFLFALKQQCLDYSVNKLISSKLHMHCYD